MAIADFVPSGPLAPGRHRLRMVKRGKWLQFLVDADHNGEFQTDFQTRWIDLAAVMPPELDQQPAGVRHRQLRHHERPLRGPLDRLHENPRSKGEPAVNGP